MKTFPEIQRLGQIAVNVADIERATAFYRDVLGIPFLFQAGPNLSFFQLGEVRLMLTIPEQKGSFGNSTLYLLVPNIEKSVEAVRGKAKLIDEPHLIANMADHELWMSFFEDTEGNSLAFMEERRP